MGLFRYTWRSFTREIALMVGALVFCIPIFLLLTTSLRSTSEVYRSSFGFPVHPQWGNFSTAWRGAGSTSLGRSLFSSTLVTVSSVALVVILGSLCAYAVARRPSKLSGALYVLFVIGIILPFQLGIIPVYVALRHLSLTGSYLGLILVEAGIAMPMAVFFYTGFIRALPRDYEEASQVDGAGLFRTYFRVVFPLLKPVTGTVAVLSGLLIWNDFFTPLILVTGTSRQTLPVGIYSFVGQFVTQWNVIFAAVAISIAPLLLFCLFVQKQLMRGFAGGVRG